MFFRISILDGFGEGFGRVWGPPNPPKSFQNRDPKKHAILHRFLLDFSDLFYLWFLENMRFASTGAIFLGFSLKSCFCNFHACVVPKNQPKILPKRGPNPSKIHAKNESFFDIDFLEPRPRFWWVLEGVLGEVWRPWRLLGASFWEEVTSLKLPPQKNEVPRGDLEGFWLNLEAPGLDFRSISRDFWCPMQG